MILGLRTHYSRQSFRNDLTAGATVAAIAVPQAIAYALLAGVDPKFGLYSAIVNTIVAAILGSSSHLINGPTNAISLVVFSALASFDERFSSFQALFLLGIAAGAAQILIGTFRLGDLTRYVSESVILGFMAGAGLLIGIGQIANFLGTSDKGAGHQSVLYRAYFAAVHGGAYNWRAIALSRRPLSWWSDCAESSKSTGYRGSTCSPGLSSSRRSPPSWVGRSPPGRPSNHSSRWSVPCPPLCRRFIFH
jgi:SulP family sulfate permease